MICCKCWKDKPCSRKICSCTKVQLKCSKFLNCCGSMCHNTWTTLDENSDGGGNDGGDIDDVEEADDNGSADE